MLHPQKRNLVYTVALILMIAISIIAIKTLTTREVEITSPGRSNPTTPAVVTVQPERLYGQLAWECPGCPG